MNNPIYPKIQVPVYIKTCVQADGETDAVFRTADSADRKITFQHTREDGHAMERRLRKTLTGMIVIHPELTDKNGKMLSFTGNWTEECGGEMCFIWDNEFSYDLHVSLDMNGLPEPEDMAKNMHVDCIHAKPDLSGKNGLRPVCWKNSTEGGAEIRIATCNKCKAYRPRYIDYPIMVSGIETYPCDPVALGHECGAMVAVRPAADKATYVGIYLGDIPWITSVSYNSKSQNLSVRPVRNPAIFVPQLNRIIFGAESWWHEIESLDDLSEISDDDINGQFYIQHLKRLDNPPDRPTEEMCGDNPSEGEPEA